MIIIKGLKSLYRYDVLPIVFGGADYTKFIPEGSYINALNYGSAKNLTDYLHFLDHNDTAYNEYFT